MTDLSKEEQRKKIKLQRLSLDGSVIKRWSSEIITKFIEVVDLLEFSEKIVSYFPVNGEVDITQLNQNFLNQKFKLYLPKISGSNFVPVRILDLKKVKRNKYNIKEPISNEIIEMSENEKKILMICPGIAFDFLGNRLGFGKGYYDRFFSKFGVDNFFKVGICFDNFLLDKIKADKHDIKMDCIISQSNFVFLKRK